LGVGGATRGNEWELEEKKADKTGKWEARGEVHEAVTRPWERKVVTISQLEQESHRELAGHKDGRVKLPSSETTS